jgi:UDP-2,4-diacetamido-2,4,6-trideoxy-beta-L-altropyranose hydrolase
VSPRAARVAFRVDSGTLMGTGHLSRCLTLAAELERQDVDVHFICRELAGNLIARVEREGFPVAHLPAPADAPATAPGSAESWLQVSPEQDAEETHAQLARIAPDWLVIDHYGVGARWQARQRPVARSIMIIDDLADRAHDCDVLLDQNYAGPDLARRYDGLVPKRCRLLLGPRHALLGREYAILRSARPARGAQPRRVLVFFGGTDATDETSKALRALSIGELSQLSVDVVVGANHPARDLIERLAADRPGTVIHGSVPSLAGLMFRADLAIGAGGVTTWERLCLGLPAVVVTVAENQEPAATALAQEGLILWAGKAPSVSVSELAGAVRDALGRTWSGRTLVDGHGCRRAAAALLPPSPADLRVTRASPADAELIYDWRNEPLARANSFNSDVVAWETHARWFRDQLADPRVVLLIARCGDLPVGQLRLDFRQDEAVVSYGVDPLLRGRGFGTAIVTHGLERAARLLPGGVRAHVKARNPESRRIFTKLGWHETPDGADFVYRLSAHEVRQRFARGSDT